MNRLPFEPSLFHELSLSADGRKLAATTEDARLWVYDLERNTRVVLSEDGASDPEWTPNGERLIHTVRLGLPNGLDLHIQASDGSGPAAPLLERPGEQYAGSLSPDGSRLAFYDFDPGGGPGAFDIYLMNQTGEPDPQALIATPANELYPRISPDGRWLAYASNESGELEIYLQTFPSLGNKTPISRGGGTQPRWSKDGRELFYQNGDAIWLVDVDAGSRPSPGPPRKLYEADGIQSYGVFPNGDLVVGQRVPGGGRHTELDIVFNWFSELERLVPAKAYP